MDPQQWKQFEALYEEVLKLPEGKRKLFIERLRVDDDVRELLISSLEEHEPAESFFDSLREVADGILHEKAIEYERPPESIGSYKIAHKIGRGGSSSVYLATRDNDFRHRIAVKILHLGLEGGSAMNRFYAERSILASLNHPNIAALYDGGVTGDGRPYLFMEYVDGVHVDEYCSSGNLSLDERLDLFLLICDTIGYAHRNLVIHRDIKPSNILIDQNGRVKLLDFGIAKLMDNSGIEADLLETRMGSRVLTPLFSSPEQIRSQTITTASDVYQLGLLLYRMLTGSFPYSGQMSNRFDLEHAILHDEPVSPSSQKKMDGFIDPASLRGDLERIILMALEKDPNRRYGSVAELAEDITRYLEGHPVKAVKPTIAYKTNRFLKRHKSWAIPTMALIIILLGSVIGLLHQARIIRMERDLALDLEQQARDEAVKTQLLSEYLIDLFSVNDPLRGGAETITARELLDTGAGTLSERFHDQPEIHAMFGETLGRIYRNMGMFDKSRELLEDALARRQNLDDEVALAKTYMNLGNLHFARRNFELAAENYRNAMLILESSGIPIDHNYISSVTGYAMAIRDLGMPDSAMIYIRKANELADVIYEESDSRMVTLRSEYAYILRGLDRLDEAELIYREVLGILMEPAISDSITTASSLNNLAYLLRLKEEYDESIELYRLSLAIHEKLYGRNHPRTIMINNNMATVGFLNNQFELADSLFNNSLERHREFQPDDHWRLGSAHETLARFYHNISKFEEADSLYRIAHQIYVIALGDDHDWTMRVMNRHALTLAELDRPEEIRTMLARVIQLTEARYGPEHMNIQDAHEIMEKIGSPDR
jgi:eukaryotic-like serine/threonine-protein kinase